MLSETRRGIRNAFPRGWWRSGRWWWDAGREATIQGVAIFAPVLLAARAVAAVRHRRDPVRLSQLDGEPLGHGLVASVAVLVMLGVAPGPWPFVIAMGAYQLLNVLVAGTVVTVLAVSRIRRRGDWAQLDWIERHEVIGRPPETVDEYRAARMRAQLGS